MGEVWLLIETSGRGGGVGLARGDDVVRSLPLDPARRHARDLAPATAELLRAENLKPNELHGVMVSVGPGSFTGLRVGVISAKMFAFATKCRLIAVPTFAAIAEQTPAEVNELDVIADGLQGLVYVQRFRRIEGVWNATEPLRLEAVMPWVARRQMEMCVSGPGLTIHAKSIPPQTPRTASEFWTPCLAALYRAGRRTPETPAADLAMLEPLYLRPSSAEEQADRVSSASSSASDSGRPS